MQESQDSPQERTPSVTEGIGELTPAQKRREDAIFGAIGLLLSQIPWIGAGFNELRQYKAQREMERLSILAHELKERMDEVSEQGVNWDFLHSEHYQDFLLKAVEISSFSRSTSASS